MKRSFFKILAILSSFSIILSCTNETLNPNSVFVDSKVSLDDLDRYIEKNYTQKYNISILHKYVDVESDLNYNLSPPLVENSVRMTRLIQYLGLEPYDEVTGSTDFMRSYFPKVLNYIGSPAYNNNGTIVLGTAEGGRKMTLFNLDDLTTNSQNISFLINMYFGTIHHEFAHILHQTIPYSPSFNQISGTKYVQDLWHQEYSSALNSRANGFITPYSSKNADEDFVELLSHYITRTPVQWEKILSDGGATGRPIMEQKIAIVRDYMTVSWNINIDKLRDSFIYRLENLNKFDQTDIKI